LKRRPKVGVKKPLKQRQIWAMRFFLDMEGPMRDRALFDLAIDSKLRGCDLVKIKSEVLSEERKSETGLWSFSKRPASGSVRNHGRGKGKFTCMASAPWWSGRRLRLPSRVDHVDHLSTRQYARLVDEWVTAIGLRREDYGTHSLRRTKAAMVDKATGNLPAIQILLGHTKIENAVRYLGVDIEDALELAEHTEI
jgi:site-specific recombinase XerC